MTVELQMLALSVVLGFVQLFAAAQGATMQRGAKWNMSPRDEKMPDLTGIPARLDRAFKNFMETFPFFVVAILLVTVLKAETNTSALGARLYFFARVLYIPLYATGIPVMRTIVWFASFVGIFMVLGALPIG